MKKPFYEYLFYQVVVSFLASLPKELPELRCTPISSCKIDDILANFFNCKIWVKISEDNPRSFLFQEQDIKITVWDNGIVDGDRIAVIVNGKYLLRDYTLDSVKKTMQISLPKEVDDIAVVVFPLNEGTEPPNTATIILESLSDSYTIELRAKKNEVRKIYLARRREKKEKNN